MALLAAKQGVPSGPLDANITEVSPDVSSETDRNQRADGDDKTRSKERLSLALSEAIRERIVALHADNPFDLIYERYSLFSCAGLRAARELEIPFVVEVNSPLVLEQQRFRTLYHGSEARAVEADVFRGADALLAVSGAVRAYALSKGAQPARTHVLPNAVDVSRFHPGVDAASVAGVDGKFVIGFAGSLKPWHAPDVLLKAFRWLAAQSEDYHLLIVGDGPLRDWIDGFASGAGLEERISVTGWVPNDRLPGLISAMDVATAPYPEMKDFYFSPLKLYEYMAVGKPIVACRVGQIAEVLEDGATGLLTRAGDAHHLAERIEELYRDASKRLSLGKRAAESVSGQTWERNARRVIEIVEPLVRAA